MIEWARKNGKIVGPLCVLGGIALWRLKPGQSFNALELSFVVVGIFLVMVAAKGRAANRTIK